MPSAHQQVAIIEDHPIVAEALERRLAEAGIMVSATCGAVEDLRLGSQSTVAVCDLNLSEGGLQTGKAVAYLVERGARVLAMSGVARRAEVLEAIASGAAGFVEKTAPASDFVDAVAAVANGGLYVSARLADYLLDDAQKRPLPRDEIGVNERLLLRALAMGDTLAEIAEETGVRQDVLNERLVRVLAAARRRRRVHRPGPRETELLALLGCEGLSHKAAAARMGVRPSVIPDFQKEIKAKYLASHPDADESIAPKTVAQLWARELGLC